MSHYVFITRRTDPLKPVGPNIPLADWEVVARSDASFREQTAKEQSETQQVFREAPRYYVWTGHGEVQSDFFGWIEGQIEVKNPDEPMIAKMMALATELGAQVISATGELFNVDGTHKGFVDGTPW